MSHSGRFGGSGRRRNAKFEREQKRAEAVNREWERFTTKISAANSFVEAQLIVTKAPPESVPGRNFYANPGFWLGSFNPPDGANCEELALYLQLAKRMADDAVLKPGAIQTAIDSLRERLAKKGQPATG